MVKKEKCLTIELTYFGRSLWQYLMLSKLYTFREEHEEVESRICLWSLLMRMMIYGLLRLITDESWHVKWWWLERWFDPAILCDSSEEMPRRNEIEIIGKKKEKKKKEKKQTWSIRWDQSNTEWAKRILRSIDKAQLDCYCTSYLRAWIKI